jgi:hypothetical protein
MRCNQASHLASAAAAAAAAAAQGMPASMNALHALRILTGVQAASWDQSPACSGATAAGGL